MGILIRKSFREKNPSANRYIFGEAERCFYDCAARQVAWIFAQFMDTRDHNLPNELQEALPRYRAECATQRALRDHLRYRISSSLCSQNDALTLLGGDFNWTVEEQDRCSKTKCKWTGTKDDLDERDFQRQLGASSICLKPTKRK